MLDYTPQDWLAWLQTLAEDPTMLLGLLAALSLVADSAAVIVAGLLVGQGALPLLPTLLVMPAALLAGDCAIYILGALARENTFLARHIPQARIKKLKVWLAPRAISVLALSRAIPGSRSIVYLSFGYLRLPATTFVIITGLTGAVWATVLLMLVSTAAQLFARHGTSLSLLAGVVAALLVLVPAHCCTRRNSNVAPPKL